MDAIAQSLPFDAAKLPGFSEQLLRSHHQNNYAGAVKRLNAIRKTLALPTLGDLALFELNGLKREELIAANSMVLHELYFASLGGVPQDLVPAMVLALEASFGSVQRWSEEFSSMGRALGGGSGWVLLNWHAREGRLVNQWATDHSQFLAGAVPVLALDMYEHAYHLDHGAQVANYVDAFMAQIAWSQVYERYQQAVHAASAECAADPEQLGDALLLDVRRAGVFAHAQTLLPGASWRDPALVDEWSAQLPRDREVLVYCIYGHEVGRSTALRLRAAGIRARYLPGGIDAWTRAGKPLQAKG